MKKIKTGIIGGSGLYALEGLKVIERRSVETPFGTPSGDFVIGEISGSTAAFLPRHGSYHTLLPGEIPFRANIFAMKKLGVGRIISVSSVGSMKHDIHPRDIVIPTQFIDRTKMRKDTFFGDGIVAHISFSDPVCPVLSKTIARIARQCDARVHMGGTYVCIEGPAFSTRAESSMYRSQGVDIIGMTNYQEARLAREAGICYTSIACVTDYDCWNESEASVSVEMLLENLKANASTAGAIIKKLLQDDVMSAARNCLCADALESAIITPLDKVPEHTLKKLAPVIGGQNSGDGSET